MVRTETDDADDSGTNWCSCPRDDAVSRQDVSTPFSSLVEFETTEYSYSIRIPNFEDIRFDIQMKFRPIVTTWHIKQWILIITKYFQNTSTLTKHNRRKVGLNNYTCNATAIVLGLNVFAFILHKVLVNSINAVLYICIQLCKPQCIFVIYIGNLTSSWIYDHFASLWQVSFCTMASIAKWLLFVIIFYYYLLPFSPFYVLQYVMKHHK